MYVICNVVIISKIKLGFSCNIKSGLDMSRNDGNKYGNKPYHLWGPPRIEGTWNLFWCYHMDGYQNSKISPYDEPNPHWCDCDIPTNGTGKWKDSTLSSPKFHHHRNWVSPCNCLGGLRGCTYTPYCPLL